MTLPVVAHVINTIGLGGVPEAAYHLLRVLPAQRYARRLYVLSRPTTEAPAREERLRRFEALGVPVTLARHEARSPAGLGELCGWLRAERVALLHTHSFKPNLYGRMAGALVRHTGLRTVAHYHNQYDDKWACADTLALERELARASDRLVACSRAVAVHVAERVGVAGADIDVVPNGVQAPHFAGGDAARARAAFGLPAGVPVVGVVGRLSEQKGQEDFLHAARAIRRAWPEARFVLAGSADDAGLRARLEALAAHEALAGAVHFLGHVGDMAALYAALDVLAAPSRWEGFGLMLVEAMAAGLPIVATRVGAIPEVAGERAAVLVPPRDADALAAAVVALLADPARRQAMAEAGRSQAARFSWAHAGERLDALYDGLLGAQAA